MAAGIKRKVTAGEPIGVSGAAARAVKSARLGTSSSSSSSRSPAAACPTSRAAAAAITSPSPNTIWKKEREEKKKKTQVNDEDDDVNDKDTTTEQQEEEEEEEEEEAMATSQLRRIAASGRGTPFERRVWSLLCQIPRGRFSTYGLLSAHLGSSPRAVGNALRRNPFAPDVPCHRVVATGGTLGGFKGSWPAAAEATGTTLDEKRRLLRAEGVRLDGRGGRVVGTPFSGFSSLK